MSNFLEKLKKGMNIEKMPDIKETENLADLEEEELPEPEEISDLEEENNEGEEEIEKPSQNKTITAGVSFLKPKKKTKRKAKKTSEESKKKLTVKKEKKSTKISSGDEIRTQKWSGPEGQLVIDLYETNGEIVIQSAIAGLEPDDLDVSIENDMVKIKGAREKTFEKKDRNYFYQECHWGSFSREIIMPVEVDAGRAKAIIKNGILTIRIPKIDKVDKKKLTVKEE